MTSLLLALYVMSPTSWCGDDGTLHVELGSASLELRDQLPVLSRLREGHDVRDLSTGRLYRSAHPVDRVEYRSSDGTERRLLIGADGWRLVDETGAEVRTLRVPTGFRKGVPPLLLGIEGPYAWFVSPTHLARVDLAADRALVSAARLGRKTLEWIYVGAGERARFIEGNRLLECDPNQRCTEILRLEGAVAHVAPHRDGLLLSTESGLSRLATEPGTELEPKAEVSPMVEGETLALCSAPDRTSSWAALRHAGALKLIRIEKEPVHYTLVELLRRSLPTASADAAEAWADALVDSQWPDRRALATEFSESKSPSLRKVAALLWGAEAGNPALARLWLLGHDDDLEVRVSAVHASASWCRGDAKMPCRAVLTAFVNDPDDEVAWTARDLLLDEDPWAALDGAPAPYRLEAVSLLSSRLAMSGSPQIRTVLERLSADADPLVRAAAQMAVLGQ